MNMPRVVQETPDLKRKLIVGLPLYGMDWEAWETPENHGLVAKEVMYDKALALQNKTKSEVKRDNTRHYPCQANSCQYANNVEPYFIYYDQDGKNISSTTERGGHQGPFGVDRQIPPFGKRDCFLAAG